MTHNEIVAWAEFGLIMVGFTSLAVVYWLKKHHAKQK